MRKISKIKRIAAFGLVAIMSIGVLSGCGKGSGEANNSSENSDKNSTVEESTEKDSVIKGVITPKGEVKGTINLWAFTDEVPKMVEKYVEANPDFGYEIKTTIIDTTNGEYQPALDQTLANGDDDSPDIYCAEAAFVLKYTKGDAASYAASYKELGIDVDNKIKEADIAQYSVDIGTNPDGEVVALGYQATGGCFMYRRSIAKDTFGTDDPAEIAELIGAGSGNWDKFFDAAESLKQKGYSIVSGDGDIWHAVENSSNSGWIVDGKLTIDSKREEFLDLSKRLVENDYCNGTVDWEEDWYKDMRDEGERKVFGYFGPAWLINYVLIKNSGGNSVGEGTYGDWAVCDPPVGFFWGGTWILANKDTEKKEAVTELIEWITLDTSETGLQYQWANGTIYGEGGNKDAVASSVVMAKSDGKLEVLGNQDMFEYFVPANSYANGKNLTQYDETINQYWRDATRSYTSGEKTREEAIENFKQNIKESMDVVVE